LIDSQKKNRLFKQKHRRISDTCGEISLFSRCGQYKLYEQRIDCPSYFELITGD